MRRQPRWCVRASDEARYLRESRHGRGVLRQRQVRRALHGEPAAVLRCAAAMRAAPPPATGNVYELRLGLCADSGERWAYAPRFRSDMRVSWLASAMTAPRSLWAMSGGTSLSFAAGRASSGSRSPPRDRSCPASLSIPGDNLRFAAGSPILSSEQSRFPDCANTFPVPLLKIPCSRESNSLFRCTGNFAITLGICDQIRADFWDKASDSAKFPVFFPDNREFRSGDRFAADCLVSQGVGLKSLRICSFLARRNSLKTSAR